MLSRYFHTIRHLQPVQFYGRLYRPRPRINGSVRGIARRRKKAEWHQPIARAASQIGPNRFRFLNQEHEIRGWNDPAIPKLWLYNLHYFDAPELDLIERWIGENPVGEGNGWEPYPLSLRIVNWIKWSLNGGILSPCAMESLYRQAEFLSQSLERHLGANHLFANLVALAAAGSFFEDAKARRWLLAARDRLRSELEEQVLSDGGHFERSPMYHALLAENLLDLLNLAQALGIPLEEDRALWAAKASKMLAWLSHMLHPDGQIPFFNDASFGIAPEPAELFAYADRLGIAGESGRDSGEIRLGESGYIRLADRGTVCLFDAAPIGPDHQPGHAHADTLSFELSKNGKRVLVNSGTSTYEKCAERQMQRGTAAHNTVRIDGLDQSEMWSAFRVARRARPFDVATDGHSYAEAAHDGYRRLTDPVMHRRRIEWKDDDLLVTDSIEGSGKHRVEIFFHLHPDAKDEIRVDPKLSRQVQASHWYPQFNTAVPNQTVAGVWTGRCPVRFLTVIPLRSRA